MDGGGAVEQPSTTFSCLTRRNHETICSRIPYCSQLVPQNLIQLPRLLESTLFSFHRSAIFLASAS